MKLVTFSGVDGSGKSTQLKLLREHLENSGKKVAYFHAVEFSLVDRLRRCFKREKEFVPGSDRAVTKASWFSLLLRKIFLILDLLRFQWYLSRIKHQGYDYLLSDRYFFDTIVNMEYLAGETHRPSSINTEFFVQPNYAFFLDVSPDTIMARERAPEQGLEYLQRKSRIFRDKVAAWNLIMIDGQRSKEEVFASLLEAIDSQP